jgi:enoyl-CoA hydratase/carnithine racemase
MTKHLTTEREGAVAVLRIERPEKKNALTAEIYEALTAALERAEADPGTRAVVITGSGDSFTAGNDLNDFLERPPRGPESAVWRFVVTLAGLETPLVAAVNGIAVGIGTTLLLHCDLAYAVPSARFACPFVNLGLVPEAGSSLLLPRVAGARAASEILLLGEVFDAERALAWGLVNALHPPEALMEAALGAAAKLAAKPPGSLRATRALLRGAPEELANRIEDEMRLFAQLLEAPEAREAFTAFREGRKPDFSKFG